MFTYPIMASTTMPSVVMEGFQATCQATATSHTYDTPADIAVGELLVVLIGYYTGGNSGTKERWETASQPAGWTKVTETNTTLVGCTAFWKIADGTEGASTTFTTAIPSVDSCARYIRLSGVDSDFAITSSTNDSQTTASLVTPAVYADSDNSIGLHISAMEDPNISTIDASGTDWVDNGITQTGLTTSDVQTQFLSKELSEGTDVSITTDTGGTAQVMSGLTLVINPMTFAGSYLGPIIDNYTYNGTTSKETSVVLTAPSGIVAGDLLVVTAHQDNATAGDDFTGPAGFTEIGQNGGSVSDVHVGMWYKVAVGGEGNQTITSSVSQCIAGAYFRITGADGVTPLDSSSEMAEDAVATNNVVWWTPGNSTAANCLSILVAAMDDDAYMTVTGPRYGTLINQAYDAGFSDGTCVAISVGRFAGSGVNGGPVFKHMGDPSTHNSIVMMANFK